MHHIFRHSKKVGIAIVGGVVVLVGLVLIPYPGPGWLIVFAGLAVLATEFEFAASTLTWLRKKYDDWTTWLKQQPRTIRWSVLAFTGLVILVTLWLLNSFGMINHFLHLSQDWVSSPFFRE